MADTGAMDRADVTIGLLWHSVNSDNLGIGALTVSHIAILDAVAQKVGVTARYKILGWRDPAPSYIQHPGVEMLPMRGRDVLRPSGLFAAARKCDLVLDISAGDSFTDIYGTRRFVFNTAAKMAVLAARRPLILSPQTFGPFQRKWTRFLAGRLMHAGRKVITRDRLSTEFLEPFNLGDKVAEATDVAFRLPYDTPPPRHPSPVRVGINVSGLLFNGGYNQDNSFALTADYPALVRAIIGHFSRLADCEVHLVGHVNSLNQPVEDDYRVAEKLAVEFPGTQVAPRFAGPSEAKSYIATMDFFCGSRMHACIAAFSSGVPVIPMAYSRKFSGLFGTLGYDRVTDCKTQSTQDILRAVISGFDQRMTMKAEVEAGRQRAEAKLAVYDAILRDILGELACRN